MNFLSKLFSIFKSESISLGLPYNEYPEVYLSFKEKPDIYGPYSLKDIARRDYSPKVRGRFVGQKTWRPKSEILNIYKNAAPSSKTKKQLENAGLVATTEVEGVKVLKVYRDGLKPTKKQREQLEVAGIPLTNEMTRLEANKLLEAHRKEIKEREKKERVQKLIDKGFLIEEPILDEDLRSLEESGMPTEKQKRELERELAKVRKLGVDYELPKNMSGETISDIIDLLNEAACEIEGVFEFDGWMELNRKPTKKEKIAVAQEIFKEVINGNWNNDDTKIKRVFKKTAPGIKIKFY